MYFAFCPGPEWPVLLTAAVMLLAAFCAPVVAMVFVMKWVSDWRKRRALAWLAPNENAGNVLGL